MKHGGFIYIEKGMVKMAKSWNAQDVMAAARSYQPVCVLLAAVDLNVLSLLDAGPMTAAATAEVLKTDTRAMTILLDALASMELLVKHNNAYSLTSQSRQLLTDGSSQNILPALRHQANCHRRWIQLPQVVKTGRPAERLMNLHSPAEDLAAFIGAMDNFSAPMAAAVIGELGKLDFRHLLDVGGASGTWTIAFLRAVPHARATLFDLPQVIAMAKEHIAKAGLTSRVEFAEGDYDIDALPAGADFVWLSAITHQNSRQQNQTLFSKLYTALTTGGRLVIRDVVMDQSRTRPEGGALFAVNMLVGTDSGNTYTFDEYRADLLGAGFTQIALIKQDEYINSLINAVKAS
jgi:precorrin-6B methylase 2